MGQFIHISKGIGSDCWASFPFDFRQSGDNTGDFFTGIQSGRFMGFSGQAEIKTGVKMKRLGMRLSDLHKNCWLKKKTDGFIADSDGASSFCVHKNNFLDYFE
ncbi:MAG: hypothetical protein Q7U51_09590 [Methanoregula sp.]|nr:hypothetical protein [Methanoregula sp.]